MLAGAQEPISLLWSKQQSATSTLEFARLFNMSLVDLDLTPRVNKTTICGVESNPW